MSGVIRSYLQPDEDIKELYGPSLTNTRQQRLLRNALLVMLFIVLVGALAILGIGIWTLEAEYGSKQLSKVIDVDLYKVDSYLLIILGAAIIALTLLGFCGVFTRYKCIMGLHLGLLAFMSVMLFVAGILGYVLISELEHKVREKMETTLTEQYGVNTLQNSRNRKITHSWDDIQQTFQCCGAFGGENSSTSWALYKTRSQWVQGGYNNHSQVPDSCCRMSEHLDDCTGRNPGPGPPSHGPPITVPLSALNYTLYTTGCYDALRGYLKKTGAVIGSCAIVVGIFMLVELVLSICAYRTMTDRR